MTITTKKLLVTITAMLAGMALTSSCSKQDPAAPARAKKQKAPAPAKALPPAPDEKSTFTAVRNGQYVDLKWHAGTTGDKIKQIDITRSQSQFRQRKVAEMAPDATSFRDCLPDEYAYIYRVRLVGADGNYRELGPVTVDVDKAGSAGYIKLMDKYKTMVTRTDSVARLAWSFPEDEYKSIRIIRNTLPEDSPFKGGGKSVTSTVAWKSGYTDGLPDPNSDYWYWFRITLKSGAVFEKGPIKAEYARRLPGSPSQQ